MTINLENLLNKLFRSSRPEVLSKKRCSWKFRKIHRKTLQNQGLFLISCRLRPATLLKRGPLVQVFSCGFCDIFKNTFFTEHLWTTASGYSRTLFHGYLCIILQRCWKPGCLFNVPEIFISGQYQIKQWLGLFQTHHLLCYHIGKSWHFLESDTLNKYFQQNSDQSSVVT